MEDDTLLEGKKQERGRACTRNFIFPNVTASMNSCACNNNLHYTLNFTQMKCSFDSN